ncbi:Hypothetical protein Nlim_1730 [Candidatus Nitrosarchaeum limnium SFB1]|uniref:Uncharacterized protein n=1 Tax=Candidatus Nitrosarchaeum limnium SFB1 TaxID=886738 RepID=F3KMI0_9ARCH|nr:Hypothetical protein Nlim_1730 [Candidatus Nitrosarchaeum limnium SFB1]
MMFDAEINKAVVVIIGLFVIFGIIVGAYAGSKAIEASWSASDNVVEQSDNSQLQQSYNVGKNMITTAEDLQDIKDAKDALEKSP